MTTPFDANGSPQTATLTAYYFGGAYELTNGLAKSYYSFAGQTIMKDSNGDLTYFLTDHLGSVVAITDDQGNLISQQRYLPFGGVRLIPNSQSLITDFGYTGQRNLDDDIGLMDYKARFYSPVLNRFIQPDSIVPDPTNPQAWNRFSYVVNSPINLNDPTGHAYCDFINSQNRDDCEGGLANSQSSISNGGKIIKPKDERDDGPITCGQPGVYSSECPNWHEYNSTRVVCPAAFQCTEEQMIDYMSRFGFPNQDFSQPAIDQYTYTVGIPILNIDLGESGSILFETSNGGLTTTNTTLETHVLYDGKVVRTASQNADGSWSVTTNGYGNNYVLGMDIANDVGGPPLFFIVDAQMFTWIALDHLLR